MNALYVRKGKKIRDLKTKKVTEYKSINAAKKESRKLQLANGGLGCGSVMVGYTEER